MNGRIFTFSKSGNKINSLLKESFLVSNLLYDFHVVGSTFFSESGYCDLHLCQGVGSHLNHCPWGMQC
jgi:hypothetical protein